MVAAKFLLLAVVACTQATPVVTAPDAATTEWTALPIPKDKIDWTNIDMNAFKNPANWKQDGSVEEAAVNATLSTEAALAGGACQQGKCPDYSAGYDLVYTFVATTVPGGPGDPPLTIFESFSAIRVDDCGKCYYHKVGSNLGNSVPGGCYNFKSCGRDQLICVDPGKARAHRTWKDTNVKKCHRMKISDLGGCGPIKERTILHPDGKIPCNW